MYTVRNNKNEFVINKSKFITFIYYVNNKECIDNILSRLNHEYYDASHIVYAYILDNLVYACDNGEPSGTAGAPILNVLKKNNLNYVLCVVIRYFGGIKLGAGGLTRAYSKCASEVINSCNILTIKDGYLIEFITDFKGINNLPRINMNVINKSFTDKVIYTIEIDDYNLNILKNSNIGNINIIKNIKLLIDKE